ncbi:hypothetical protein MTO96_040097, partial [Rhipicephalus appendiculatus]
MMTSSQISLGPRVQRQQLCMRAWTLKAGVPRNKDGGGVFPPRHIAARGAGVVARAVPIETHEQSRSHVLHKL